VNRGGGLERGAAHWQEPGRGGGAIGGIEDVQARRLHHGGADAVGGGAGKAQIVPEGLGVVRLQGPDFGLGLSGDDGAGREAGGRAGRGGRVEVGDVGDHRAGFGGKESKAAQLALVVGRQGRVIESGGFRQLLTDVAHQLQGVLRLTPLHAWTLGGALVGTSRRAIEDLEVPERELGRQVVNSAAQGGFDFGFRLGVDDEPEDVGGA